MKLWQKFLLAFFLATALIVVVAKPLKEATVPSSVFSREILKLAVMADIHSDWQNFEKALKIAKNDGFNLVVVLGDLTTVGEKKEFLMAKKILDESGLKYQVVPGNHDLWFSKKIRQPVYQEVFPKDFESLRFNDLKLILINNADYGQEQKLWLKNEVAECLRLYCLALMHLPLNHPYSSHVMGEDEPAVATEAGKLREVLVKNGVKEIFTGHIHLSAQYEIDELKTTIVGAITEDRNPQAPRFLEISIGKQGIGNDFFLEKKEIVLPVLTKQF